MQPPRDGIDRLQSGPEQIAGLVLDDLCRRQGRLSDEFADTNVVLSLLDDSPKADRAEAILEQGPRISVQVLDETWVNCRRKAGLTWGETEAFLAGLRALCPIENLTLQTHDVGRALAERHYQPIDDVYRGKVEFLGAPELSEADFILFNPMG